MVGQGIYDLYNSLAHAQAISCQKEENKPSRPNLKYMFVLNYNLEVNFF